MAKYTSLPSEHVPDLPHVQGSLILNSRMCAKSVSTAIQLASCSGQHTPVQACWLLTCLEKPQSYLGHHGNTISLPRWGIWSASSVSILQALKQCEVLQRRKQQRWSDGLFELSTILFHSIPQTHKITKWQIVVGFASSFKFPCYFHRAGITDFHKQQKFALL